MPLHEHSPLLHETVTVPGGTLHIVTLKSGMALGVTFAPDSAPMHDPRIDELVAGMREVRATLQILLQQGQNLMADLTALQAEVENNTNVEASVVTLINGLASQIATAGTDQAQVDALVATLRSNDAALAAAVTANTPTAPTP